MPHLTRRSLRNGILLPFALLVLLCAGLVGLIERSAQSARWVAHGEAVIAQIDAVQKSMIDEETAVRGFLLTEQPAFLAPRERATTLQRLDVLDGLVGGDPLQAGRARALRAAYLAWRERVAAAIADPAAGRRIPELVSHKGQMDALRAQVDAMLAAEATLQATRVAASARHKSVAEFAGILVAFSACALMVLVARRAVGRTAATYAEALRSSAASEMRLRRLWESNIIGVMYSDVEGNVTDANDAVLRMIGYTAEEVRAGRVRWNELTPPEYRAVDEIGLAESLARGACTPYEKEYVAKDGRRVPILIGYALLEGSRADHICFLLDLSERAQLLASERAARAEAERASRLKDEFVATVSHELRTPLNAILGWTKLLQRPAVGPAQLAKGLDVIERNTLQLTQLVSDLLDTSRIVTGKFSVEPEPVDLPAVTEAALEPLRAAAAAKGVALEEEIEPPDGTLHADPKRLRQVVDNLVSNAIKFTPAGGRVSVRTSSGPESITLRVRDTGEGLTPEFLPHIFSRFRQADASSTRRYGGLGLGLAIVKHIVEQHGGTVHAKSDGPGQGAELTVTLPLEPPPSFVRPVSGPVSGSVSLSGVRVLVVDDEPDTLELAQRVLEESGATVVAAGSGAEALAAAKRTVPDVVISDIGMPGMDGYELARRLRADAAMRGVPMLAVTAFAGTDDCARAVETGFDAHVAKPVEPAALIAAVAAIRREAGRIRGAASAARSGQADANGSP
jgi:hypothetical protein